jgi:hypothetical protein
MSLKEELKLVTDQYEKSKSRLEHNEKLFNIHEGDLLGYVLEALQKMLSTDSFKEAESHVAPINVLKRMIDKLSKLYAKTPNRKLSDNATENDKALFTELYQALDINTVMGVANEFFNLFKNGFIEPFLDQGVPKLRVIPSDRFIVYSTDPVNPLRPTHYSKIMGVDNRNGDVKTIFYTYTKDEFLIHDQKNNVLTDLMRAGGYDGKNAIGRIPGVYINRSRHDLLPKLDTDTLRMSILIPILLSDVNFATKFQCFSIVYGINITGEGMKFSPNVIWSFKTDPSNDQKPEIGTINPSVDSDKALNLIKAQLGFWLQSRNIKPGAMGDITPENMASGFAKVIDEMDTSEDRQKQVPFFMTAEQELADLLMYGMQPYWQRQPGYKLIKQDFSQGLTLTAHFSEQRPMVDSSKVIDDEIKQLQQALTTRKLAIKKINPDMDDAAIDVLIKEIDQDRKSYLAAVAQTPNLAQPNPNAQPAQGGV